MASRLPRALRLAAFATLPAMALTLGACSDNSGETTAAETTTPAATETKPDRTTTTAAVNAPEPEATVDFAKMLEEGALPDKVIGSADAPVTIVEYASLTCGHCAHFHEATYPQIKENYIDTGKVRFILREFPFDPRATAGFMLARCSGDNYYPMVDVLFRRQDYWARAPQAEASQALFQTVKIAGFSQESFDACLKDQELLDKVNSVRKRAADEFGVQATPTFFINGKKYSGALPIEEMSAIIDSMD